MCKTLANAPKILTEVVVYHLDITTEEGSAAYSDIKEKMAAQGTTLMRCISTGRPARLKTGPVTIETDFLFANQSNTSKDSETNPNSRIFDWYEEVVPNKDIRCGHYTVVTEELRKLRDNVLICGYCGNREWADQAEPFCTQCLGSSFLKESELHLLVMLPISADNYQPKEGELSLRAAKAQELGLDDLRDRYYKAQLNAETGAIGKKIEAVKADYERKERELRTERDGLLWLLERGIRTENCIYYAHKNVFSFGWRNPLSDEVKIRLKRQLQDFPFQYELK